MSGGRKIGARHEAAMLALMTEATIERAAERAGIGQATLRRWLKQDAFREAYEAARVAVVAAGVANLQGAVCDAVATLKRNLTCGRPTAEVAAARTILELTAPKPERTVTVQGNPKRPVTLVPGRQVNPALADFVTRLSDAELEARLAELHERNTIKVPALEAQPLEQSE